MRLVKRDGGRACGDGVISPKPVQGHEERAEEKENLQLGLRE